MFVQTVLALLLTVSVQCVVYDISVLKYQALDYSEIEGVGQTKYRFGFCFCPEETSNPDRDADCRCETSLVGKDGKSSVPKAIYSTSCLHSVDSGKCLVAKLSVPSKDGAQYLYVTVAIGDRVLTTPKWQTIAAPKYKTTANLRATTKAQKIWLSYVVLVSDDDDDEPSSTMNARPKLEKLSQLIEKMKQLKTPPKVARKGYQIITTKQTDGDVTINERTTISGDSELVHQIGDDIFAVRDFLLQQSIVDRVDPRKFDTAAFRQAMLRIHNRYRYKHDSPPLSYDASLEKSAQVWAQRLARSAACLEHDPNRRFGENLFYFASSHFADAVAMAEGAMKSFYMEGNGYNYQSKRVRRDFYKYGHFTQLVWRDTSRMGVGVAIRKSEGPRTSPCQPPHGMYLIYVVVKYDPRGNVNIGDDYTDNVRPVMRA